jgi:hypothetical protein
MPYPGERDTGGNVWRPTPYQIGPMTTGAIQGIWAGPNDDVDWHWTFTPEGSYVNGYTVRRRVPMEPLTYEPIKEEGGK